MKWVARERPVIDRVACPWLIVRFIDREPAFLFAQHDRVLPAAAKTGDLHYEILGVELTGLGDGRIVDCFVSDNTSGRWPALAGQQLGPLV